MIKMIHRKRSLILSTILILFLEEITMADKKRPFAFVVINTNQLSYESVGIR